MLRPLLAALLPVAALATVWLGRASLVHWRDLRAARTYGLPAESRPLLLQLGGAVLSGLGLSALTVTLALGGHAGRPARAAGGASPAPPAPHTAPAPAPLSFTSIGHPAGGELLEGAVPDPTGRSRSVRVWLPPQYRQEASEHFPVIVLTTAMAGATADVEMPDVFDAIASAWKLGRARPFVVVAPASSGAEQSCGSASQPPDVAGPALQAAIATAFRTLPGSPKGWRVLGVGDGASCAATAGLTRPELYGAAAALSGRYDATALVQAATAAPAVPGAAAARLLLAAAKDDTEGVAAARALQSALREGRGAAARATVRVSDGVQDISPDRARTRLIRVAVQYLTENLPG